MGTCMLERSGPDWGLAGTVAHFQRWATQITLSTIDITNLASSADGASQW